MKRIKAINGYTIYQATTARDEENYRCRIGHYNVYLSADIRDFGLANSYPEWDDEDSLAVVIARCNGSHYAVACELADELSNSTIQDMDLVMEIERRLEAGEAVNTIRESFDTEEQCFIDTAPAGEGDTFAIYEATDMETGETWVFGGHSLEDACTRFIQNTSAVGRFDLWMKDGSDVGMYLGEFDRACFLDDAALADGPEGDLEDVLDAALEQHEPTTCREWMQRNCPELCGDEYPGGCCGCPGDKIDGGTMPGSAECEHLRCEDCWDRPLPEQVTEPVEDEQHWYLTVISWDDNGHTETCYDVKRPEEIFGRIDMYDCYEEDLSLWLLTPEGPLPCDWHGTWHDINDPLKMSITLRSTGNVLDLAWGSDH